MLLNLHDLKSRKQDCVDPSSSSSLKQITSSISIPIFIFFIFFALVLADSSEASIVSLEDNSASPERDFITLFTPNAAKCHEACQENSKCVAYSWRILPSLEGEGICSLKKSIPEKLDDPCCVTGVIDKFLREPQRKSESPWNMELSLEARTLLSNPPDQLSASAKKEFIEVWKRVSEPVFHSFFQELESELSFQVDILKILGLPYVHFVAKGENLEKEKEPGHRLQLEVLFSQGEGSAVPLYEEWYNPPDLINEKVEFIDFEGGRASFSKIAGDDTEALYWNKGNHYVRIHRVNEVKPFAGQVHKAALNNGFYKFPANLLIDAPSQPVTNVGEETPESAPLLEFEVTQNSFSLGEQSERQAVTEQPMSPVAPEISKEPLEPKKVSNSSGGLYEAVLNGDLSKVERLIAEGVEVEKRKEGQSTPLLVAVSKEHEAILKALILAGANIEAQDEFGVSALEIAAVRGLTSIVQILVEAGADLDRREDKGAGLLALAALGGHLETLKYLLKLDLEVNGHRYFREGNIYFASPLMAAAGRGETGAVLLLLKAGADPQFKGEKRQTALMLAAENGTLSTVSALLAAGADLQVADEEGNTPLDIARNNGREMVARLLENLQDSQVIAMEEIEIETTSLSIAPEADKTELEIPEQQSPVQEIPDQERGDIFEFQKNVHPIYLGCFKDDAKRDLTGFWKKHQDMTTDKCANICKEKGFSIAGTQFGTWCFCDNDFGHYGTANNCNMKCGGNPDENCGGKLANSIFKLKSIQKESMHQPPGKEPLLEPVEPEILNDRPGLDQEDNKLRQMEQDLPLEEPELSQEDFSALPQNVTSEPAGKRCETIAGTWNWHNDDVVLIYPDGSMTSSNNKGTWKCVDSERGNFSLKWERGGYVHQLTLSHDGGLLTGTDQTGEKVTAKRSKEGNLPLNKNQEKAKSELLEEKYKPESIEVEKNKAPMALIESVKEGSWDRSLELIHLPGINIDAQDESEMTALMWAAKGGRTEIAKELLNAGANLNIKNKEGKNALDLAREERHASIVPLLDKPPAVEKKELPESEKIDSSIEYPLENDFDRPGNDISGFIALSLPECRQLCANEPGCSAFTWIRPGYEGPFALCMLKSSVPNKIENKCCVSGIVKINAPPKEPNGIVMKNPAERKADFPEKNPESKIP